jgi:hypothetical protein
MISGVPTGIRTEHLVNIGLWRFNDPLKLNGICRVKFRVSVNDGLESMWMEVIVAYCKALPRHMSGRASEKPQSGYPAPGERLELMTF